MAYVSSGSFTSIDETKWKKAVMKMENKKI